MTNPTPPAEAPMPSAWFSFTPNETIRYWTRYPGAAERFRISHPDAPLIEYRPVDAADRDIAALGARVNAGLELAAEWERMGDELMAVGPVRLHVQGIHYRDRAIQLRAVLNPPSGDPS